MSDTISRSAIRAMPIVGAAYRPPASAILGALPAGASLLLRPEPSNPFDPNAVMVVVTVGVIRDQADAEELAMRLGGFGMTYDELTDEFLDHEYHLGYIAKTFAASLAPVMAGAVWPAELLFSGNGSPLAKPVGEDD